MHPLRPRSNIRYLISSLPSGKRIVKYLPVNVCEFLRPEKSDLEENSYEARKPSPTAKQSPSSGSNLLTPSELDSLKKESKDAFRQAKGRFKDLG